MSVNFDENTGTFKLDTQNTSMIFRLFDNRHILSEYWGVRIQNADLTRLWQPCGSGFSPVIKGDSYSLDLIPTEYPAFGSGDFRSPAINVKFPDGNRLLDLRYKSHTIKDGDTYFEGLPHLDGADQTLEITLQDEFNRIEVVLRYSVFEEEDIISRSACIRNLTGSPAVITRAFSASIDLPGCDFDMISLYGSYARERQIDRTHLHHGTQSIESRRGASSHQQNPFIAIVSPETTENSGDAYAAALVYSGNFIAQAEVDPFNYTRLQIGINPFDFEWNLDAGDTFTTPEAVLTYSSQGLNKMSQNFHSVFKYHLGHTKYRNKPRPIVINSWEATYFNFDEAKLIKIIESCKGLGIETFVLDDGWFGHRDDDTTSLGDWFEDRHKLPNGLDPLIKSCENVGMKFGLWFEPEMISEKSKLYEAHPEWCIRYNDKRYCFGRNQLVLDLSQNEVLEYLKKTIGSVLKNHRISYVKWDMNRHITDAYSVALPADRQSELYHRYILNLYKLLDYLTSEFPNVIFEGCSGGGGRFDAGMLYYMPQIWASDNTDAVERLKIQYGTSMLYPPQCMTAHVSACPNHQMGRNTPFYTRGLVAMSASLGYELDPLSLTEQEREEIKNQTAMYKKIAPLITDGVFYRLMDPYKNSWCAWMFVSQDKCSAFCVCVQQLSTYCIPNQRVKMAGLDPLSKYHIDELNADFNGDELMYAGIALPHALDFEACCYTLKKYRS